jgi:hypothetical protein
MPLWVKGGHAEQVAAVAGSPQKAALLAGGPHLQYGPQRDENREKSAILKRTFRGPGTKIAAARTK